jgi:hypothetical protein
MKTPPVSIPDAISPSLDIVRSLGGQLGLRPFRVTVQRRVWTGARPALFGSTYTDQDVVLTNRDQYGNPQPVLVRQVSRREAIASAGFYTNRDLKVGPVTPSYAASVFGPASGFSDAAIDPAPDGQSVQIIWVVSATGGTFGLPPNGAVFEKIGEDASALHYYAYIRQTGRSP